MGGVEATTVPLFAPRQLVFDAAGNLYIADAGDNLIREVSLTGVIVTMAGSGQEGFAGDGGLATSAQLDSPSGVAIDADGNLYIADTNNNRIREVSRGVIRTIAGKGTSGFGGDNGAATSAELDRPTALTVDAEGQLDIADTGNQRIRRISGMTISTVAGDGIERFAGDGAAATAASLDEPLGVAVDAKGDIYIGDTNNQRVRMVSAATGIIDTIAGSGAKGYTGDGPALAAALASPSGVAVDGAGNVYFADADNDRIRVVRDGSVVTLAGMGVEGYAGDAGWATSAQLDTPRAVLVNGATVLLSDTANNLVRAIDAGRILSSGGVPAPGAESLIVGGAPGGGYGTGTLTATFSHNGVMAAGRVSFYDQQASGPVPIGYAQLARNVASIGIGSLAAGPHAIMASYSGDASSNPIDSGVYIYTVSPAPLIADATGVKLLYGQAIPPFTGALTGVLARDAGKVTAVYTSAATSVSAPGIYPIAVSLAGPAAGNYRVMEGAGSGSVVIGQAPTTTTLSASTTNPIVGASIAFAVKVGSDTGAEPAGTVNFYDGSALLNPAPVAVTAGMATFSSSALAAGAQSLTAVYSGDADFRGSTSVALSITGISPDFAIAASSPAQTLLPSQSVEYPLTLTPVNPTFVYPVTLRATGLPAGVTAAFTPASLAAGAGTSQVKLTLSASSLAVLHPHPTPGGRSNPAVALAFLLPVLCWRRARGAAVRLSNAVRLLLALVALAIAGSLTACGGGGFFSHATQSYTVTVTAVCGPGTHATSVNVTLQ